MQKLPAHLREQLRRMPETGMGYQLVDVVLNDGRVHPNQIALNGECLQNPDILPESIKCLYPTSKSS